MVNTALLVDGVFGLTTAGVYAFIGRTLWSRRAEGDSRSAALAFATWWHTLGAVTALSALMRILAGVDALSFQVFYVEIHVAILLLSAGLWGLVYYLAFVLTGNARLRGPLAIGYAGFLVACIAHVARRRPIGIELDGLSLRLAYERADPILQNVLVLALLVPPLIAAAGYLGLLFRVRDRTSRYRISLVAGSILAWFGSVLLASEVGLSQVPWWPIASRLIGLAAALTILAAYLPPSWIKRRFGVRGMREDHLEAA